MSEYSRLLGTMMDAILAGNSTTAAPLLRDKQGFPATAQMDVYVQGYRLRFHEVLESTYPALLYYLKKEPFTALAERFINDTPSQTFNIDRYTIGFADYVQRHCENEFARELAMLEGAIHAVYQQEESPAADLAWSQQLSADAFANATLRPRTASQLLSFSTAADDYLTAFRNNEQPEKPEPQATWLMVLRHQYHIQRIALSEGEYTLLQLLNEGLTLAEAIDDPRLAAFVEDEQFGAQLQQWLSRWLNMGMLTRPEGL